MRREPSEKKALKLYGETENLKEAGWILPSGKVIEWADAHDCMAAEINDCQREDLIQQGWIRVISESQQTDRVGINISAYKTPTIAQLRRICELVEQTERECFTVEWEGKDWKTISRELPTDPEEVMYCMGIMHQVGFDQVYQEKQRRKEKGETK